jgi:signal transduction histidine kinase
MNKKGRSRPVFINKLLSDLLRCLRTEIGQNLLVAVFVGLIAVAISVTLIRTDFRNGLTEQRLDAIEYAEHVRFQVERTLDSYGVLSESIAAILADRPDMSEDEFSTMAENVAVGYPEVLNIAAAPDLVVRYVHPFEPNQEVIGLDYRDDIVTFAAIQRALRYHLPVFSGPRPLVQGGTGIIVRTPVNLNEVASGESRFWGVTAIVVELQSFLTATGVLDSADPWQLSIRRVVSSNDLGEVFLGDPSLFRAGAVTVPISLQGLEWELALAPAGGWLTAAPNLSLILILVISFSLIFLSISLSFIRMFFERERARQQLLLAIETINDGFVLFDADERLVLCNDRYREIHADIADLLIPGQRFPGIVRRIAARDRNPVGGDHKTRWIDDQMVRYHAPGGVIERRLSDDSWLKVSKQQTADGGLVELSADITELKNAKLDAEAASEAKSEFLNLISHELRTPLTIVLGYLAFLARPEKVQANIALRKQLTEQIGDKEAVETLFDQSLENSANIAARAEASAKHLLDLMGEILDLSKIESGEISLDYVEMPVGEVLNEISEQFTGLASKKGLTLTATGDDFTVQADRLRLRQILINLVANAVKFTKAGEVRLWADISGDNIWFHVEDTGPGIPASDFESVFKRFKQLEVSSTRSEGGVGLGLSICKRLVDLHGGTIEVESEVGVGSHFKFSVPLHEKLKAAA